MEPMIFFWILDHSLGEMVENLLNFVFFFVFLFFAVFSYFVFFYFHLANLFFHRLILNIWKYVNFFGFFVNKQNKKKLQQIHRTSINFFLFNLPPPSPSTRFIKGKNLLDSSNFFFNWHIYYYYISQGKKTIKKKEKKEKGFLNVNWQIVVLFHLEIFFLLVYWCVCVSFFLKRQINQTLGN